MSGSQRKPRPKRKTPPAASRGGVESSTTVGRKGEREPSRISGQYRGRPAVSLAAPVQTKVTVGRPGDRFEREADSVADHVSAGKQAPAISRIPPGGLRAQGKLEAGDDAQTLALQREPEEPVEEQADAPEQGPGMAQTAAEDGEAGAQEDGGSGAEDGAQQTTLQRREDEAVETAGPASDEAAQTKCAACEGEEAAQSKGEESESAQTAAESDEAGEAAAQTQTVTGPAQMQEADGDSESSADTAEETAQGESEAAGDEPGCGEGGEAAAEGAGREEGGGGCGAPSETPAEEPTGGGDPAAESAAESAGEEQATEASQEGGGEGCGSAGATAQPETAESPSEVGGEDAAQEQSEQSDEPAASAQTQSEGSGGEDAAQEQSEQSDEPAASAQTQSEETGGEDAAQEQPEEIEEPAASAQTQSEETGGEDAAQEQPEEIEEPAASAQTQAEESGGEDAAQEQPEEIEEPSSPAQTQAEEPAQEASDEPVETRSEDPAQEEGEETAAQEQTDDTAQEEAAEDDASQTEPEEEASAQTKPETGRSRRDRHKGAIAARAVHGRGAGEPLAPSTREPLERSLGVDLDSVRIHSDGRAHEANRGLRAKAFTHKNHIWLGPGQDQSNLKLMAHEVTHTVQQGAVDASRPPAGARGRTEQEPGKAAGDAAGATSAPRAAEPSLPAAPPAPEVGSGRDRSVEPPQPEPRTGSARVGAPPAAATGTQRPQDGAAASERRPGAPAVVREESEMPPAAVPTPGVAAAPPGGAEPEAAVGPSTAAPVPGTDVGPTATIPLGVRADATRPRAAAMPAPAAPVGGVGQATPAAAAEATAAAAAPTRAASRPAAATAATAAPAAGSSAARTPAAAGTPGPAAAGPGVAPPAGGMAGAMGEPSALLGTFRALSPLRAPREFKPLATAVGQTLRIRRTGEVASAPSAVFRPGPMHRVVGRPAPPESRPAAASSIDRLPGEGGVAPSERPAPHAHAGEPARPAGAGDAAAELDRIPDEDGERVQRQALGWSTRFLASLPVTDAEVNANPGAAPRLRMTGAANPAQVQQLRGRGRSDLGRQADRSAEDREQDFGEDDVGPDLEAETLTRALPPRENPNEPRCPKAEQVEPYRFDPVDEADLSARVRPQQEAGYEAERTRLGRAESDRDQGIARGRAEADRAVAARHQQVHAEELRILGDGQRDVAAQRRAWSARDTALLSEYESEAGAEGDRAHREISDHGRHAQDGIERRRDGVGARARQAETDAAKEAEQVRREGQEQSGSWISRAGRWIKGQVRRLASWASEKISQVFKALREKVKQWFDEFKAWALEQIEKARRWIVDKLEGFRRWLNGLVDRYLARFPGVARYFKRAINGAIDLARRGVNAAARGLKKAVTAIVDGLARLVDGLLGAVEGLAQLALWAACNLAVLGVNLAVLAVDQDVDALIELIRDLPEPGVLGPLWPAIKYGLLGYLERLRDKPADEKKRYERKTRELATSLSYYGGIFLGVLKGFVWDGLVGMVTMLYDIVVGIPQAIGAIYDFFKQRLANIEAIDAMVSEAQGVWQELKTFMARPDAKEKIVAFVQRAPSILHGMVRDVYSRIKGWAYSAGAKAADTLFAFVLGNSPFDIGLKVGAVVGQVLFEVALLVFTSGAGTLVKWGGKALQVLGKAGRWLASAAKGGGMIMRALGTLKQVVVRGIRMAQRIGRSLRGVFVRLERLVKRVFDWFRGGLAKLRRGGSGRAARRAARRAGRPGPGDLAWRAFRRSVRALGRSYSAKGVRKRVLRGRVGQLVRAHRSVVSRLFVITAVGPNWRIWAKRKGLRYLPKPVGLALMDHDARWAAGRRAVLAAIRRVKRRPGNIGESDLQGVLRGLKRRFRYSALDVDFLPRRNIFRVEGAMSAKRKIASTPPELDHMNAIRTTASGAVMDNLAYRNLLRTPASGTPTYWPEVQIIKAPPGYRVPPYVKGHLIAGWFAEGTSANLTPITRKANREMEVAMETPLRRLVPTRLSLLRKIRTGTVTALNVYRYTVRKIGKATTQPPLREVIGPATPRRRVATEKNLPKKISMKVEKKRYDKSAKRWVIDSGGAAPRPKTVDNVPPYPAGKIKPVV